METNNNIKHEIELYPVDSFEIILDHEARKSRRYKYPLALIHIAVEADPNTWEMPSTDEQGGRRACARLERALNASHQIHEGTAFLQASGYIGLPSTSNDPAVSAARLIEEASTAMNHARTRRCPGTVVFSDMK